DRKLDATGSARVGSDASFDADRALVGKMVGSVEDILGHLALHEDALDNPASVADLEEMDLPFRAAVVEPTAHAHSLANFLAERFDSRRFHEILSSSVRPGDRTRPSPPPRRRSPNRPRTLDATLQAGNPVGRLRGPRYNTTREHGKLGASFEPPGVGSSPAGIRAARFPRDPAVRLLRAEAGIWRLFWVVRAPWFEISRATLRNLSVPSGFDGGPPELRRVVLA